ncbi:ABC transporter substrate-binding protein [Actinocorallia populi]|uniref:ABC transporter substrate-binding protein n=1 Tax=Actinocorallia populi TaxID=2079200 RepID=UPI000D08D3AE|nr:ABC transporter substrate-binding protein [Actinocorallia populi]
MRRSIVAASAAAFLFGLSACGGGSSSAEGSQTLTLAIVTPPTSFEPGAMAMGGPEDHYYQAVYDTLLALDAAGKPAANVATAWSYDPSNTRLSLTLREDVTFTDGTKLDAAAVKANLEHAKKGTGEAASALRAVDEVNVTDAAHAEIVLSAPDPSLVPSLARSAGYLASPKALGSPEIKTAPVGSGPYRLDKSRSTSGDAYVFTRNESYWNKSAYPYDQVDIKHLDNTTAAINGLRSGQILGVSAISKDIVQGAKQAGLTVATYDNGTIEGIFLWDRAGENTKALGDLRVRRAINHALDRETIVENVKGGLATPSAQIFAPTTSGYDKALDDAYPYDVAKAKRLMAEAGYASGFTLTVADFSPVYPDEQAAMTESLAAIGIKVKYTPITADQAVGSIIGGRWPINYFNLTSSNPWAFAQLTLDPKAAFNPFHVTDPKVTELLETIRTSDSAEQDAAYKRLNAHIVDQAWFAPWAFQQGAYALGKSVEVTTVPGVSVPPLSGFAPAA